MSTVSINPAVANFTKEQVGVILEAAQREATKARKEWRAAEERVDALLGALAMAQLKAYKQGCPMTELPQGIRPIDRAALFLRLIYNGTACSGSHEFPGWIDVECGLDRFHMPVPEWHEFNKEMDARREAQKARRF